MRLVLSVMTLILVLVVMGFVLTNLDARTDATVGRTLHKDVPLYLVVILAVVSGAVYVGVIAVTEGAAIRLANRRLEREVQRLESELMFYRTQGAAIPRIEPDALAEGAAESTEASTEPGELGEPSSAPIYDSGSDGSVDPVDDAYSGGRAV